MLTGLSLDDSELVFDDDDDITMARSVTFNPKASVHKVSTKGNCDLNGRVHGVAEAPLTNVVLPYVIDYWYDRQATKRASIQIHMLSGNQKLLNRVSYRVSTSQLELVVTVPLSTYMICPERALCSVALAGIEAGLEGHKKVLDYHPKVSARRLFISQVKQTRLIDLNVCEFRIPILFKCNLNFATVANNDPYFYGNKFIVYPDGSTHLHVELLSDEPPINKEREARSRATYVSVPESVSVHSTQDDDVSYMDVTINSEKSRHTTRTTRSSRSARSAISRLSTKSTPMVKIGGYEGSLKAPPRKAIKRTPRHDVVVETATDDGI